MAKTTQSQSNKKASGTRSTRGTGRSTVKGSRKKSNSPSLSEEEIDNIILLVTGVIALLLALSNFELLGKVGEILCNVQYGIFGVPGFIFPFLFFVVMLFILKGETVIFIELNKKFQLNFKMFLTCCLYVIASAIMHMTVLTDQQGSGDNAFKYSADTHTGGGIIGGIISGGLYALIDKVGTWIVLVIAAIVLVTMICELNLPDIFARLWRGAAAFAEDADKNARKIQEKRRKYEEEYEPDEKASGVSFWEWLNDLFAEEDIPDDPEADEKILNELAAENRGSFNMQTLVASAPETPQMPAADVAAGYFGEGLVEYDSETNISEEEEVPEAAENPIYEEAAEEPIADAANIAAEPEDAIGFHDIDVNRFTIAQLSEPEFNFEALLIKAGLMKKAVLADTYTEEDYYQENTEFDEPVMYSEPKYFDETPVTPVYSSDTEHRYSRGSEYTKEQEYAEPEYTEEPEYEYAEPEYTEEPEYEYAEPEYTEEPEYEYAEPEYAGEPEYAEPEYTEASEYEYAEPEYTEEPEYAEPEYTKEPEYAEPEYTEPVIEQVRPESRTAAERKVLEKVAAEKPKSETEKAAERIKAKRGGWIVPGLDSRTAEGQLLLTPYDRNKNGENHTEELRNIAEDLKETLESYGVKVSVGEYSQGPAVTRFEMIPERGVKVSKILNLADDIQLFLAAKSIRIEAPIPGKSAVGIEIPNKKIMMVTMAELLASEEYRSPEQNSKLAFAVGKGLSGVYRVANIGKMPHVLIAGATGSGKSVCINTLIMSLLFKYTPDELKLMMIDPKVVELSVYNGIPHLMIPVITDTKQAADALRWCVAEMDARYIKFANAQVRDIAGYNKKILALEGASDINDYYRKLKAKGITNTYVENTPLPKIVVIVDELADLMMTAGKEVEASICRLAQLARACGIHLVIATQRPSVDVITGLIKANMPSRIAFSVSSNTDSRTILDQPGAEKLLGNGDMLFFPQGQQKPDRLQGAFVSDEEVSRVVKFWADQVDEYSYKSVMAENQNSVTVSVDNSAGESGMSSAADGSESDEDEYLTDAARFIIEKDKASIGMLQRKFRVGFNRAARLMDTLYEKGVVSEEEGTKPRRVLMSMEQFDNACEEGRF